MNLQKIKSLEDLQNSILNNEITTFSQAIRAHCLDCSGYERTEVDNCPNETSCALWKFRKGKRLKKDNENE